MIEQMSDDIKQLHLRSAIFNAVSNKHKDGDYIKMLEEAVLLLDKQNSEMQEEIAKYSMRYGIID